ncbi:hypothetical protein F8568_001245 [Actinomadura sp. LD22]|uniref:Uncharacterized protein n=1 Tax=Actinomadura physcomitrii TaxID=2650748 RepID=A0A6I4LZY8_9ACTN|nr:hypothetical protein [Actinomadura physcomitrii]MVZ99032.1 hypothetical protein [Actinomadura physcomitrii]
MVDHETPTNERTELLAGELHERARALNNLTQGPPGLTRPETAYRILGDLAKTAFRLVGTAEQLDAFLNRELDAGRLLHYRGDDPVPTVLIAHDALAKAGEQSMNLGESFRQAQAALSGIHGPETEPGALQHTHDESQTLPDEQAEGVASDIRPAARDFPHGIGDVLSGPPAAPSSPDPRPHPKPPHPRREL